MLGAVSFHLLGAIGSALWENTLIIQVLLYYYEVGTATDLITRGYIIHLLIIMYTNVFILQHTSVKVGVVILYS